MAYRFQRIGYISGVSRYFHSVSIARRKLPPLFTPSLLHQRPTSVDNFKQFGDNLSRCYSLLKTNNDLEEHEETLSFIKSALSEIEGPNHQWLNYMDQNGVPVNQDGIFLVIVNSYSGDSALVSCRECAVMFEKVKLLQHRFPKLIIFGLQCGSSAKSTATHAQIIRTVMEEYITFPILISDKSFMRVQNGVCCLLFDGSTNHLLHHEPGVELENIVKVIEDFDVPQKDVAQKDDTVLFQSSRQQGVKELHAFSPFRNLLLYHPGCVSVDEDGNRLFISDCNHHRIVITDGDGKILDFIGSSPGFEDGEFESAKVLHPAASFYDSTEDCLYFVDSKNNAIRRADMERRVLETMFPAPVSKTSGIWSWILDMLGFAKEIDVQPEEFNLDSFTSPWHLLKLGENDLVIINRGLEVSWIMNTETWQIREVTKGIQNVLENYGHMIEEKLDVLKNTCETSLSNLVNNSLLVEGIPCAGLMSSIANFHDCTIFCDGIGHRVFKYHRESRTASDIQFSNLRLLGLPYWLVCPLETVFNRSLHGPWKEHLHHFSVQPGRCDIRVTVDIPIDIELVEPLEDDCVWRQSRGSVAEVSGSGVVATSTEKVGVAQQWFDELDNLAFSKSGNESGPQTEEQFINRSVHDMHKTYFDCAVNISPGIGEVVVSAVLYLKLSKTQDSEDRTIQAARILNIQKVGQRNHEENACLRLLSETGGDFQDAIFMRPLHLRIRLDCADHPTATTHKETILTDTALEVNVSLD